MKPKAYDAVATMRELRDQLSKQYARMTVQEEMADLQRLFPHIVWKERPSNTRARVHHHQEVAEVAP